MLEQNSQDAPKHAKSEAEAKSSSGSDSAIGSIAQKASKPSSKSSSSSGNSKQAKKPELKKTTRAKVQVTNCLRVSAILFVILIIPLQIFLKSLLVDWGNELIIGIQTKLGDDSALVSLMNVELVLTDMPVTLLAGLFFFLSFDSLLAFKTTMLYCIGQYCMMLLKMLYNSPRPFWMEAEIKAMGGNCSFDFASPSNHLFNLTFFWSYMLYHQLQKPGNGKGVLVVVYFILAAVIGFHIFGSFMMGLTYLYQGFTSILYCLIFLAATAAFDREILSKCEDLGFIVRSSRSEKFKLLFFTIFLFLIGLIVVNSNHDEWAGQTIWTINLSNNLNLCKHEMFEVGTNRVGIKETFLTSSVLFFMLGMGFGSSYSLVQVGYIDWVKTSLPKRLVRGAIGCVLAVGFFFLCQINFSTNQKLTKITVNRILPNLLIPFFLCGPFLIICDKLGLVDKGVDLRKTRTTRTTAPK